jgi:hypothetical protein
MCLGATLDELLGMLKRISFQSTHLPFGLKLGWSVGSGHKA